MLNALLVAFNPFKFFFGPAFIIVLALVLSLLLKYPAAKGAVSLLLIVAGFAEAWVSPWARAWDFTVALITLILGFALGVFALIAHAAPPGALPKLSFTQKSRRLFKKIGFSFAVIAILVSSVLISARATNLIREDAIVNFQRQADVNLTVNATVTSVEFNHEVGNGFSYHTFPAYIIVNVSHIISFVNSTGSHVYSLPQDNLRIYCEKTDYPELAVGQTVEISGYYEPWFEDKLYSNMLLVSDSVSGSYLKAL